MKYQNESLGSKSELREFLKGVLNDMFSNRLTVEGQTVEIPEEEDLDFKVKYSADEDTCSLTIKVTWDNDNEEEKID